MRKQWNNFDEAWDSLVDGGQIDSYRQAGIDTEIQHLKMVNWLTVNPPKKNYRKFIINWLNNTLEKASNGKKDSILEAFSRRRTME